MVFSAVQDAKIGDELPTVEFGPITRSTLALYAGASGDDNPIHIDIDFARNAGLDDVFAHGMLSMAQIGRVVSDWAGLNRIQSLSARFAALAIVGDVLTCSGRVVGRREEHGLRILTIELTATNTAGQQVVVGEAEIKA